VFLVLVLLAACFGRKIGEYNEKFNKELKIYIYKEESNRVEAQ